MRKKMRSRCITREWHFVNPVNFVNFLPSLHSTSQLDRNIKGQMIKDLLNLAGFCIPENLITTSTSRSVWLLEYQREIEITSYLQMMNSEARDSANM